MSCTFHKSYSDTKRFLPLSRVSLETNLVSIFISGLEVCKTIEGGS